MNEESLYHLVLLTYKTIINLQEWNGTVKSGLEKNWII